ncbi:MAG TPA: Hsp33 family molecular chaperone HslO [Mariprofundaceae bacterium]|nr:Hsp33 family molecular chaperone HslO [Mariprofundaceae bacterium]
MAEHADSGILIRFLLPGAYTRGALLCGQGIAGEGVRVHGLAGEPADLFGKVLIASVLLLSISKGGIRQVLQLDARPEHRSSPLVRIMAEAAQGSVRGYVIWREDGAMIQTGSRDMTDWLGRPMLLSTVRDLGIGHPYISTIEHDSEHLADHLVHYLSQSVQVRADVALVGTTGLLIEAMPGCDDEHWFRAVQAMAAIPSETLAAGDAEAILDGFSALGCKIVEQTPYRYQCRCSEESMAEALRHIPRDELASLADENGEITISCEYCNRSYRVPLDPGT